MKAAGRPAFAFARSINAVSLMPMCRYNRTQVPEGRGSQMKARLLRAILGALALLVAVPTCGFPQAAPPPPPGAAAPPPGTPPPVALFTPQQLDQMLAPIALYPDALLVQVLTAATYPLEVAQAAAWVQAPGNAGLTGDALTAALANQGWDPSVMSLVPFPRVLLMMNGQLAWLQAVGNAFLAQQPDVMNSVQRLRQAAQAAGTLVSGPQESVVAADQEIEIQSANPQMVYMPCYNPAAAYGAWPYADYPPDAFSPWSGCNPGAGLGFSVGINIVPVLWGWGSWDWRNHRVQIDASRFNGIDPGREHVSGNTWTHDPTHRRGVAYPDPSTRARFAGSPGGAAAPAPSRETRGFAAAPAAARPAAEAARPAAGAARPAAEAARPAAEAARPAAEAARPAAAPARPAIAAAPARPAAAPARPAIAAAPARAAAAPARPAAAPAAAAHAPPPALAHAEPGPAARAASARGNASLAPPPRAAAPAPRAAAPAPRAAPAPAPRAAPPRAPAAPAKPHP